MGRRNNRPFFMSITFKATDGVTVTTFQINPFTDFMDAIIYATNFCNVNQLELITILDADN